MGINSEILFTDADGGEGAVVVEISDCFCSVEFSSLGGRVRALIESIMQKILRSLKSASSPIPSSSSAPSSFAITPKFT